MGVFEIGLLYITLTFILLFSGVPIAYALGGVALLFMFVFMPIANVELIAQTLYGELNNFTLLAIPLFILMGAAIGKTRAHKSIEPLAPVANRERLTDPAKVEKWFKRNCKDVLARECTAQEKADFLAFLISVK